MKNKVITLCYRKIIDINSTNNWDKLVFNDSFIEFKMQAQLYNTDNKYRNFSDLIYYVPAAEKLHFLVSAAIIPYLKQLKQIVPDIVDNLGKHFIGFTNFKFEIINSNINDINQHQIGITFYSEPFILHETVDKYLLISNNNEGNFHGTYLLEIRPFLSINSISYQ